MRNRTRVALALGAGLGTMAFVASLDGPTRAAPLPEYWDAPAFQLVDQAGRPFSADELRGSVWVADFVFTSCIDVCPAITARMARLADDFRRERVLGHGVRLVSFTVDPERDTPAVLRDYAAGFGELPPGEWAFLTGVPGDSVRALIQRGFKLTAMKPAAAHDAHDPHDAHDAHDPHRAADAADAPEAPDYQVMHSPRMLLVDAEGTVRGIYDGTDPGAWTAIVSDALTLLAR